LKQHDLKVDRQVVLPINYKNNFLGTSLRIDLLIEDKVVVECKAVHEYNHIFEVQTLTYLRVGGYKLGMVINFGEKYVKNGIHRIVNGL
jgi:GxxExxY protein